MAHSVKIITHVVYLLLAPVVSGQRMPECVAYAFDILTNIGKTIDLSGKKRRFLKDNWMMDTIIDDDKETLKIRCSSHYSIESSDIYMIAAQLIFPRLVYFMGSMDRDYVYKGIECFGHLVQAEENVEILNDCPMTLPNLLIELLCVSTTLIEPATPTVRRPEEVAEYLARPAGLVCSFVDQSDIMIRDSTLYALYMLICMSSKWRHMLPSIPRALEVIRRVAFALPRTDSSSRSNQMLAVLTMDTSNKVEYLRQQSNMCVGACRDEVISGP